MSFNEEAFRLKSNGLFFQVPVIHDFTYVLFSFFCVSASVVCLPFHLFSVSFFRFNLDCQIDSMILYQDPYVAAQVFSGYAASSVPVMPGVSGCVSIVLALILFPSSLRSSILLLIVCLPSSCHSIAVDLIGRWCQERVM